MPDIPKETILEWGRRKQVAVVVRIWFELQYLKREQDLKEKELERQVAKLDSAQLNDYVRRTPMD